MIDKLARRLPFFYGWVVVAVAFVTMAIGVNARTAFSLLFAPIVGEFGWERAVVAGAFSFGFLGLRRAQSAARPHDGHARSARRHRTRRRSDDGGPAARAADDQRAWHLYSTLGLLVGGGSVCLSFTGQSLYLPNWFVRRRGLAMSVAFAGVGRRLDHSAAGVPDLDRALRLAHGLRHPRRRAVLSCSRRSICSCARSRPISASNRTATLAHDSGGPVRRSNIVDAKWAAIDWTLSRALKTSRFWMLAVGYFSGLFSWYAVQVHQTKYLVEIGYSATDGRLGARRRQPRRHSRADRARLAVRPHRPRMGLDDRFARLRADLYRPARHAGRRRRCRWLYALIVAQGLLGYGVTAVFGSVAYEIFEGRHYGSIFGALSLTSLAGGAAGPFVAGAIHDLTGSYNLAFWLCIVASVVSIAAIWLAAPRKVRAVAGRIKG